MKKRRRKFIVSLSISDEVTDKEIIDYIREAVQRWAGQFYPGGPGPGEKGYDEDDPLGHIPDPFFAALYDRSTAKPVKVRKAK